MMTAGPSSSLTFLANVGGRADGAGVLGGGAGGYPGAEWAVCGAAQEVDHWSRAVRQPISHLHG